jgi:hypothetical protein
VDRERRTITIYEYGFLWKQPGLNIRLKWPSKTSVRRAGKPTELNLKSLRARLELYRYTNLYEYKQSCFVFRRQRVQISARSSASFTEVWCGFLQSLQANSGRAIQIWPWTLPSTAFSIYCLSIIPSFEFVDYKRK